MERGWRERGCIYMPGNGSKKYLPGLPYSLVDIQSCNLLISHISKLALHRRTYFH